MDYTAIKASHMGLAYLSFILFNLRFWLFYWRPSLAQKLWLRIPPHLVDSALLVFAIWLCFVIDQYPLQQHWLTAKVLGLIAYIGIATVAIKRQRLVAYGVAILVFAYIFGAAKMHSALSWLAPWFT